MFHLKDIILATYFFNLALNEYRGCFFYFLGFVNIISVSCLQ